MHTGSYTSFDITFALPHNMPSSLVAVKEGIISIPNENNRRLVYKFLGFMETTDTSENYQRGNLIVVVFYAKSLGTDVNTKDEVIGFLDIKKKDVSIDPDRRWIRTWNDYLQRIKHFMRWLHNGAPTSMAASSTTTIDWQTPDFVRIKTKKTNRVSPYSESEIWERDDLLRVIKYEPLKRNKAALALCWDLDARPVLTQSLRRLVIAMCQSQVVQAATITINF
jgi:integrase/recombinase XerD